MRHPKGIAFIVTLAILLAVGILVFGTSFTTLVSQWTARNDRSSTETYYVAETGLQQWKTRLFQTYRWQLSQVVTDDSSSGAPSRSECSNILSGGIDWNRNGVVETGESLPYTANGTVALGSGTGNYRVTISQDPTRPRFMILRSVGTYAGDRSTTQATFDISNTGMWNYAIFSGKGAANKHLNGGATVRGGLYIEGESTNPNKVVIDSNGNFKMENEYNYAGDSTISPRLNSDMRTLSNLCATLRVQYGQVEISGSVEYGDPSNKLLGAYVGDSDSDIYGNTSNVCQANKGLCTEDRGVFDLPPNLAPKFPYFDSTPCDTDSSKTWAQCAREEATTKGIRITPTGITVPTGATFNNLPACSLATIISNTSLSNVSSSPAKTLRLDSLSIDCTYTVNGKTGGFKYDSGSKTLEVYGTVNLDSINLAFNQPINYRAHTFDSAKKSAAFFVENASANISQNLLPDNSYATFPSQVLSVMAEGELHQLGSNAMGVFYAGQRFRTQKDQRTLGTVVANEFCTTSAGNSACNAGQKAEVAYIPTMGNIPAVAQMPQGSVTASFRIMSYERR